MEVKRAWLYASSGRKRNYPKRRWQGCVRSHARKCRLMFAKNGFIYPQVKKKAGQQEDLGKLDDITPFGRAFLNADTYAAVQE